MNIKNSAVSIPLANILLLAFGYALIFYTDIFVNTKIEPGFRGVGDVFDDFFTRIEYAGNFYIALFILILLVYIFLSKEKDCNIQVANAT